MRILRVSNPASGALLADRAAIADTSATRRKGLLKHGGLGAGEGLWIVPTEGVHTIGMKFPIDILFLSRNRTVLKACSCVPSWRFALCLSAHSVLELPAGTIEKTGTTVGDQLVLATLDTAASSPSAGKICAIL